MQGEDMFHCDLDLCFSHMLPINPNTLPLVINTLSNSHVYIALINLKGHNNWRQRNGCFLMKLVLIVE